MAVKNACTASTIIHSFPFQNPSSESSEEDVFDTEFPGIVLRPVGTFKSTSDYHYQTLKANVNLLKLIQLGLTFSDKDCNLPTCGTNKFCIWQFNFRKFNPVDNVFANDSIELLRQSGIDFKKNSERGVDAARFAELLMSSGIVLNDAVHWVTFNLIKMYFPTVYDIKHLMKFCNSLHGGLNKLAELLEVERVGICRQAGSDSLLTSSTFRKLKESFFNGSTERYAGVLYGLGVESHHSSRPPCESSHSPTAAKTRLSSLSSSADSSYLSTIHTSLSPTCSPLKSIPTGKTPPAGWTAAHGLQSCEFRASGGHWNRVQSMRNQSPDICQPWTEAVRRACDLWPYEESFVVSETTLGWITERERVRWSFPSWFNSR